MEKNCVKLVIQDEGRLQRAEILESCDQPWTDESQSTMQTNRTHPLLQTDVDEENVPWALARGIWWFLYKFLVATP